MDKLIDIFLQFGLVVSVSGTIGGLIWFLRAKPFAPWPVARVYATEKRRAHFYRGKPGKEPRAERKLAVYNRDKWRCVHCSVPVIHGNANTKDEFEACANDGALPGNVNHRVPKALGGGDDMDNLETTCQPCNLKISDSWTKAAEGYCRRHHKTVWLEYDDRPSWVKDFMRKK